MPTMVRSAILAVPFILAPAWAAQPSLPSSSPRTVDVPTGPAPAVTNPASDQAAVEKPTWGPYVERGELKDWKLTLRIRLNSQDPSLREDLRQPDGKTIQVQKLQDFRFKGLSIIFPSLGDTASSVRIGDDIDARIWFSGSEVDARREQLGGIYQSGVKLMRWDIPESAGTYETKEVAFEIAIPVSSADTQFDEAAASRVGWPEGRWPAEPALTFGSQLFVDNGPMPGVGADDPYDPKALDEYLRKVLSDAGVGEPRSVPPVRLAKIITRAVWGDIQPTGDGLARRPTTAEIAGIDLQGPARTLSIRKGSEHDIAVLTTNLFRRAGIPTRLMVGFDVSASKAKFLKASRKENDIRTWVEFCLYDEARNTINWVPVDVARLRKTTSRPPPVDKPWRYFGTHNELGEVLPFAMHLHPPTDVLSYGAPAFWGWYATPAAPAQAFQSMLLRGEGVAKGPKPKESGRSQTVETQKLDKRAKGR